MMHVKFYAISILFLVAVGACFLLIAMGYGPNRGIAADNAQTDIGSQHQLSVGTFEPANFLVTDSNTGRHFIQMEVVNTWIE